jgi:hypothetical protein
MHLQRLAEFDLHSQESASGRRRTREKCHKEGPAMPNIVQPPCSSDAEPANGRFVEVSETDLLPGSWFI